MEVLQLILIGSAVLLVCIAGMSISIWIKKDGRFPDTEVGTNPHMRKLGLTCAKQEEIALWKKHHGEDAISDGCAGCGCMDSCTLEELKKQAKKK